MRRRRLRRKGEMENERRKPLTTAGTGVACAQATTRGGGRQASCVRETTKAPLFSGAFVIWRCNRLSGYAWRDGVWTRQPVDEVVWRPGARKLHLAVLQQFAGGGEFVLVAFHALRFDEMRDVQQHLAVVHGAAGDLFILWSEEALHLDGDCATFGLPLALTGSGLAQVGEIFLAHSVLAGDSAERLLQTTVIDSDLQVHLCLTAQAFHMRRVLALIGADGAAKRFIIGEDGAEAEGKDSGESKAVTDHACVIFG